MLLMDQLPPEVLTIIFENLNTFDLLNVRQLSHLFCDIACPLIKLDLRIEHIGEDVIRVQIKTLGTGNEESLPLGPESTAQFFADLFDARFDFIIRNICKITARNNENDIYPVETFLRYIKDNDLDEKLRNLSIVTDLRLADSTPLTFLNWLFRAYPNSSTSLVLNIEKSDEKDILTQQHQLVLGPNLQELSLNTFTFSHIPIDRVSYDFVLKSIHCPLQNNLKSLSLSDASSHMGEYQATVELAVLQTFLKNCVNLERMSSNFKVIGAVDSVDKWLPNGVTLYKGNWLHQLDPNWFDGQLDEGEYMELVGYWGPN